MADTKELPYFKLTISKYITGDITQCSLSAQGLYINLCCLYWIKSGNLYLSKMLKKFPRKSKHFDELLSEGIIKVTEDKINISFLDEQLEERGVVSVKNSNNAKAGWEQRKHDATALPSHSEDDAKTCNIEKRREEKNREEKRREEALNALPAEVLKSWYEWEEYRKEIKKKISPSTAKKQIDFLLGRAGPEMIAILNQSIQNGWTGLFELKQNNNVSSQKLLTGSKSIKNPTAKSFGSL